MCSCSGSNVVELTEGSSLRPQLCAKEHKNAITIWLLLLLLQLLVTRLSACGMSQHHFNMISQRANKKDLLCKTIIKRPQKKQNKEEIQSDEERKPHEKQNPLTRATALPLDLWLVAVAAAANISSTEEDDGDENEDAGSLVPIVVMISVVLDANRVRWRCLCLWLCLRLRLG